MSVWNGGQPDSNLVSWMTDLVAQAAAARVDHDADLPHLVNAHLAGSCLVKHLVHHLDLCVVVSRTQSAHLQPERGSRTETGSWAVGTRHRWDTEERVLLSACIWAALGGKL